MAIYGPPLVAPDQAVRRVRPDEIDILHARLHRHVHRGSRRVAARRATAAPPTGRGSPSWSGPAARSRGSRTAG